MTDMMVAACHPEKISWDTHLAAIGSARAWHRFVSHASDERMP